LLPQHGTTNSFASVLLQCACVLMDLVDPNLYISMLPDAMKKVQHSKVQQGQDH
jgi:hypothetical protein